MHPGSTVRKVRLAYVVSHPIQYQADLLRNIAADPSIALCVFFCSDFSAKAYQDEGFGVSVAWDVPLLSGYRYVVLQRWLDTPSPSATKPIARGFYRALRRGLDGQPFDAVWVHGYSTVNSLHAMLAAKALGLPVLVRSDSWLGDRARSAVKRFAKRLFFRGLKTLVDGVLAVGSLNVEYWRDAMGEDFPIFLMPYAVNNRYFADQTAAAESKRASLQREFGIDATRPVILFASKLQERKHCDHLLEAYVQLRRSTTMKPQLVVVGDGTMRAQLEAQASASGLDGIFFVGFRNQGELPRFFDMSSVFVLPARHEPWGLVVNEAMAAGLPVIVSDQVGAARDIVRHGENGYVYPSGDIEALRAALDKVLAPGVAAAMGRRSREILSTWSFTEDLVALHAALEFMTRQPMTHPALQK